MLSNDDGSTSRTVPVGSIVIQSITEGSASTSLDRTSLASGPSIPVSERAMLAFMSVVSTLARFALTASEAMTSLHKVSPLTVCGPKVMLSKTAFSGEITF